MWETAQKIACKRRNTNSEPNYGGKITLLAVKEIKFITGTIMAIY